MNRYRIVLALMVAWVGMVWPRIAAALPEGAVPAFVPVADPSTLCAAAVNMAQAMVHTPPGLLNAIATVESGRQDAATGHRAAWPWTIDANGAGHMYATEAEAIAAAQSFESQGINSLDIGCMQINLAHHPDAFTSLAQAFDPVANAVYGAQFLRRLKTRTGGWTQAVAAYHSQTAALGTPYAREVFAVWHDQGGPAPANLPQLTPVSAMTPGAMTAIPTPDTKSVKPQAGAIPLRHFGVGGFAFTGLRGRAELMPVATAIPSGGGTAGAVGRGLAAYRRDPIPITGAK
ncbi:MAG: lytic transglycosylase domain-containing protein [Acidiphilium sp.]|jgi:hypothetical protein|nr:lytic transglycosylase domain-containing protein [Acidiphilium sp.]